MRQRDFDRYHKRHIKLWTWLEDNPTKRREDAPFWKENGGKWNIDTGYCFACYVADSNDSSITKGCEVICPINSYPHSTTLCGCKNSPYAKYTDSKSMKTKSKWAKIIAELPWINKSLRKRNIKNETKRF